MARPAAGNLTKTVVDNAQPSTKQYDIWDGGISGFGLRVFPAGTKTFILRYRPVEGGFKSSKRFMVIGRYGVITLEQARKQAWQILSRVTLGEDPVADRDERRKEMRIVDLVDLYEKEGCYVQRGKRIGEPLKPLTKQYTLARLRHHVVPLLGSRPLRSIKVEDIERFSQDVTNGKTSQIRKDGPRRLIVVKGGDGAARKAVRDLSVIFRFAMRRELMDRNPVEFAAVRKVDNQRTRYLNPDELEGLGGALSKIEDEGGNPKAIAIIRLWALTGCRREEISGLKWSEVQLSQGLLTLESTKTGRSIRPLNAAARAILRRVTRTGSAHVFPADSGEGYFQGTKKIWKRAVDLAGLVDVTPHTLRHTLASTAVSAGETLALTGPLLGHASPRSTAIYAHIQTGPMLQTAERVGATIALALGVANSEAE